MKWGGLAKAWQVAATVASLLVFPHAAAANLQSDIKLLLSVNTPHYTGGLSRAKRALAVRIVEAMRPKFPAIKCGEPNPASGELVGYMSDRKPSPRIALDQMDPDLAAIISAARDGQRQEVRDIAAFTIGLIGPSARATQPYLEDLFGAKEPTGGWYNDALEKVSCEGIIAADFQRSISKELLPPEEPWKGFLTQAAVLMAKLYLDEDLEYPPGMMGDAYGNYAIADFAGPAVPFLAQILANVRLSEQKKAEAARAIYYIDSQLTEAARQPLEKLADHGGDDLRWWVTQALVKLHSEKAVPELIKHIGAYLYWDWANGLCAIGPKAISAEDRLIEVLQHSEWASNQHAAARVLGCLHSAKSIPALLSALRATDWELSEWVAAALGNIEIADAKVIVALDALSRSHWSAIVRRTAAASLAHLSDSANPPPVLEEESAIKKNSDGSTTIVIKMGPAPVDHGLPYCDPSGKYSIDGKTWFGVRWIEPSVKPLPRDYSIKEVDAYGTREFYRVGDGWLYGAYRGHYDGSFEHVSYSGAVTELGLGDAAIMGFVRQGRKIFAYGYEVLSEGDGGSLFDVRSDAEGHWVAKRIAVLPSPPMARGVGPNGELLLTDEPNTYAVIDNQIVPLKCEKTFSKGYFRE